MNGKIWLNYNDISGRLVFVHCLEEFKDKKRHFEINWPVDEDTEALPVTAADVDGFITKSLDEVDIFS